MARKNRPWYRDPITLLFRLLIAGIAFGVVSFVVIGLMVTGPLNPMLSRYEEQRLSDMADEWAIDITGFDILRGATVQHVEVTTAHSQKVVLQLSAEQTQQLIAVLEPHEQWEKRPIPFCEDPDNSSCGNPEFACYKYSSIADDSTFMEGEFCERTGVFRLAVSYS